MLIEEIERLRLELLRPREQSIRATPAAGDAAEETGAPLAPSLHRRLQRAFGRDSDPALRRRPELADEIGSGREDKRATTSPEALVESLRRQE
jgi:hypothetical protein